MFSSEFSVKKAHQVQRRLSSRVVKEDKLPKTLRYVAGVDVAYLGGFSIGAVAVHDYSTLSLVETQSARVKTRFPYIPTLLSWREIDPARAAVKKVKTRVSVFLVDAQGIAHPYRLGFASHLGLVLDKPTVGVAKSLLCGRVEAKNKEGWAPIIDKGEVVGAVLETGKTRPIYVSVGHRVSLETAIEITKHCMKSARIPEPIRVAHNVASEEKKKCNLRLMQKTKGQ